MNAQLRANRLEVTDRFPMLGYSIRTDGQPQRAELALTTDPELLRPQNKGKRTRANFFSTRAHGVLRVPRGEAVYLVPPEVMLRFVGQAKLYAAMALTPERSGANTQVAVLPDTASPYVSLRGLSGRSLRRVRLLPTRGGYGSDGGDDFAWAGDDLLTGVSESVPQPPATSTSPDAATAPPTPYDDGFGPLPSDPAAATANRPVTPSPALAPATPPAAPPQGPLAQAQEIIQPYYDPADPSSALVCQDDAFSQAREEWFAGVPNTQIFPHSAICLLEMKNASGAVTGRGTGFYIGANRILTAGHNLHGQASVDIIPGNHDQQEPFGRCNVGARSWRVSNRYPAEGSRFDLAVIDNVPLAAPGGRWFEFLRATPSQQMAVVVCGYSSRSEEVPELTAAINGRLQHLHAGYVSSVDEETFDYPILTLKRASGSPVYHLARDGAGELQAYVVGVHVSGAPAAQGLNRGCFLTPNKLDWIEGRSTALGRALEIPLDPGTGGRSVGVDSLQPADIIVSTARHPVSYAIRGGTLSAVSHAMLYVGDGKVIEAVGEGVREIALASALHDAILAVAYRVPQLSDASAAAAVAHARSRVGDPYNYAGVAFSGYRILHPLAGSAIERLARRYDWDLGQAGAAYCSELVLESFERAGHPLSATAPELSTPEDLAQLGRRRLNYVGHLIASDETLGIPLTLARGARALDASGMTVSGERVAVTPPSARRLGELQRAALEAALAVFAGPLAPLLSLARAGARANGLSIGIGPAVGAGLGAGGTLGAGLIFLPDGGLGVYGAAEVDIGFIASISATVQLTVVRGGIEAFGGWGLAAAISGGEGVVGGAAALFDMSGGFQGVSLQLGVGAGLSPVDFYVGIQRQVATQLSLSLARTLGAEGEPVLAPAPAGAVKRTETGSAAGATWTLEQLDGLRLPPDGGSGGHASTGRDGTGQAAGERRVALDDWPYLDTQQGPLRLPLQLSWRYQGGGLGDIRISAGTPQVPSGCAVSVSALISHVTEPLLPLATRVMLRHALSCVGRSDVIGVTQLTLFGDGTYERQDRWEAPLALAA